MEIVQLKSETEPKILNLLSAVVWHPCQRSDMIKAVKCLFTSVFSNKNMDSRPTSDLDRLIPETHFADTKVDCIYWMNA